MYCISSRLQSYFQNTMVLGKVKFDRKVFGRMTKQRKLIMSIEGVSQLDLQEFPSSDTMEVRVNGTEEGVSRAIILVIELAEGCEFPPSNIDVTYLTKISIYYF